MEGSAGTTGGAPVELSAVGLVLIPPRSALVVARPHLLPVFGTVY